MRDRLTYAEPNVGSISSARSKNGIDSSACGRRTSASAIAVSRPASAACVASPAIRADGSLDVAERVIRVADPLEHVQVELLPPRRVDLRHELARAFEHDDRLRVRIAARRVVRGQQQILHRAFVLRSPPRSAARSPRPSPAPPTAAVLPAPRRAADGTSRAAWASTGDTAPRDRARAGTDTPDSIARSRARARRTP